MVKWRLPALAGLALGLVVGCGPVLRSAARFEVARQKVESALMPNLLDYTVRQPSQSVALATAEALRAGLAESKIRSVELTVDDNYDSPDGKPPVMGEVSIPDDYPAFWMEGLPNTKGPTLVNCRHVEFSGKTKDGEKVDVHVRLEVAGSDRRTVVSVQVGGRGDSTRSKFLIDAIAAQVQNLSTRPGSPEERAALKAAFDPGPKGHIDHSEADGEFKIKIGPPQPKPADAGAKAASA